MKTIIKIASRFLFLAMLLLELSLLSKPASALTCQQLCRNEYNQCIDRCINFGIGVIDCNTYFGCTDDYNMCIAGC